MVTGVVPHVGGPILPPCKVNVLTGKLPQARISDMAMCVGPPDVIVKGSATVLVGGLPAARMGDMTAHGGVIVSGCFTVLIGDAGGGGGGGGGAAGAMASAAAFSAPALQAQALIAAAKAGVPFCEKCAAAAAARAGGGPATPEGILDWLKPPWSSSKKKGAGPAPVPGAKLQEIAKGVNPNKGTINCGNIIDAARARFTGTDPKAVAPTDEDGSFPEIEKRFGTKISWNSSFKSAFDKVQKGGNGSYGIVGVEYSNKASHVLFIGNDHGKVGIVEGQVDGGKVFESAADADAFYNRDGGSTVGFGMAHKASFW
jgi:uncharacterized Zn-binding protein involved in type VI secretion